MPESEPSRILAVLPMDPNADPLAVEATAMAVGLAAGFTVLEVVPLKSIEKAVIRFEIDKGGPAAQLAAVALGLDPRVENSQPEYRYRSSAASDPFAWMNYGAEQIGAQRLHGITDGAGVVVAVIDTGVDASHPELTSRIVDQVDVSGFGISADRHGTAIAGIIAAESNNGIGSYGVAPATKILAIKACEPESQTGLVARCWSSTIAKALDKAIQSDALVINMSLGGPDDPLVKTLVDAAIASDRLVIAAAGNDGPDSPAPFPASHPGVLAVTAVDARDQLYARAVRGDFVDVAAPGVQIAVPVPGEVYPAQLTGTSMATAHVSGAAALLLSINQELTGAQLRESLVSSAVDLGAADTDSLYGSGRIDVCASVKQLTSGQTACPEASAQN
jgi:subtilisin family serine protease